MNARTLLFKQLQQFFEVNLTPEWRISDVVFSEPELAPKELGLRQRWREVVIGHFGDFTISISSTVEEPPLGKIVCTSIRGREVEGIIDETTWRDIASMVKSHERAEQNVYAGR